MSNKNKSVEEVVEEINQCIRINSNASICTNCAGGGYDYEESRDCQKCQASGITNWDFDYLNKRLTEIIHQERQTSQEREREMKKEFIETLHQIIPHTVLKLEETSQTDYDRGYIFYQNLVVRAVLDAEEEINQSLTNPNKD